jgi:hypothetical protein
MACRGSTVKRPLGRPPLASGQPSAAVHLKLAPMDYDRAEQLAKERRKGESIQDVIRLGLRRLLTDERSI